MNPVLSIIVPCYNVSRYVSSCLHSIFACELEEHEYEVICVNDGSTDDTLAVLQHFAKKHSNLSIIDLPLNQGLSVGRNIGLKAAKGEYIWFVDSDDTIESKNVRHLVDTVRRENLDVLLFNYTDFNEDGTVIPPVRLFEDSPVMRGEDFADYLFGESIIYYMGYVVRFIVNKHFLIDNNIFFPEKKHWEDTVWMPKVLLLSNRIQSTSICGYYYWHHKTSICGRFYHNFPAKLLYERCFDTARQLVDFSNELGSSKYAPIMHNAASNQYINKLPIYLFRSNYQERHRFMQIIKSHKTDIAWARPYMSSLTRIMTTPIFGLFLSDILALCYKLTHQKKHSYI